QAEPLVFNGIAFCYDCHTGARRKDSERVGGATSRLVGLRATSRLKRGPNRHSAGEFKEFLDARPRAGILDWACSGWIPFRSRTIASSRSDSCWLAASPP